jgi:hypothetical protein
MMRWKYDGAPFRTIGTRSHSNKPHQQMNAVKTREKTPIGVWWKPLVKSILAK